MTTDRYRAGAYFSDSSRHSEDAAFKAEAFVKLLGRVGQRTQLRLDTMADVGCGSGHVAAALRRLMPGIGYSPRIQAWDVSPHVRDLRVEGVEFVHGDFCAAGATVDLVTLFDVFEHVPGPLEFLRQIASRCRWLGIHIPLDDCWNCAFRNLFRDNLRDPGHLIALDTPAALNLLSLAGLVTVDYDYTLGFRTPSGRATLARRVTYPIRAGLAALSPWLLSKTLGGASLMVFAEGFL